MTATTQALKTVFDSPQFRLQPDNRGARSYANVDNRLNVALDDGTEFTVPIEVPAALFTFLHQVANIPPERTVTLALDQLGGKYVLSVMADDDLYDLWTYVQSTLPKFILMDEYRENCNQLQKPLCQSFAAVPSQRPKPLAVRGLSVDPSPSRRPLRRRPSR